MNEKLGENFPLQKNEIVILLIKKKIKYINQKNKKNKKNNNNKILDY
jgi:hypothetical protein